MEWRGNDSAGDNWMGSEGGRKGFVSWQCTTGSVKSWICFSLSSNNLRAQIAEIISWLSLETNYSQQWCCFLRLLSQQCFYFLSDSRKPNYFSLYLFLGRFLLFASFFLSFLSFGFLRFSPILSLFISTKPLYIFINS